MIDGVKTPTGFVFTDSLGAIKIVTAVALEIFRGSELC